MLNVLFLKFDNNKNFQQFYILKNFLKLTSVLVVATTMHELSLLKPLNLKSKSSTLGYFTFPLSKGSEVLKSYQKEENIKINQIIYKE